MKINRDIKLRSGSVTAVSAEEENKSRASVADFVQRRISKQSSTDSFPSSGSTMSLKEHNEKLLQTEAISEEPENLLRSNSKENNNVNFV